jgi:hypothetical protein
MGLRIQGKVASKDMIGTIGEIQIWTMLDNEMVPLLNFVILIFRSWLNKRINFMILIIRSCLNKRMSLFLGNTH